MFLLGEEIFVILLVNLFTQYIIYLRVFDDYGKILGLLMPTSDVKTDSV